jgi:hypothetical protein
MTPYEKVRDWARLFLQHERQNGVATTLQGIQEAVSKAASIGDDEGFTDADSEKLIAELESYYEHSIGRPSSLSTDQDNTWAPWVSARRGKIQWPFWERYKRYLQTEHLNEAVLQRLEAATDDMLDFLGDPDRETEWDRRGLAVGLVQSGKTSHYIGVINKAIDAGYKLIVIVTGFTESLRLQTQIRVERGVLGYSLKRELATGNDIAREVGVGLIHPLPPNERPISGTTQWRDFRTEAARSFGVHAGGAPLVFVVKKNATVLKHLLNWARNFGGGKKDSDGVPYVPDVPMLVIDDESDVGSVDTVAGAIDDAGDVDEDHNPSTINKQIRKLLTLFDQSSYIGYTATPFANVLIHDEGVVGIDHGLRIGKDLFPSNFIISLASPTNHIGPSVIFGTATDGEEEREELPILRDVKDSEVGDDPNDYWMPGSHKRDHIPRYTNKDEVPPSLKDAVLSFILVCAARDLRGDGQEHNSMLVHVTRFVDVQERVLRQIEALLQDVRSRLRNNTADRDLRDRLKQLWERDFITTTKQIAQREGTLFQNPLHTWSEIESVLVPVAGSIECRAINGESGEVLDYENHSEGLNIIAVGGDKLARGLTLDGLSVSYFLRGTRMYDTLMQMGRWFGYRPGYLDLCRLYTTVQMRSWFAHIADATQELRNEFEIMKHLGRTPSEFGLRVQSHPTMLVTSRVKSRYARSIQVSFHGDGPSVRSFTRTAATIEKNWHATERLIESIDKEPNVELIGKSTWTNVSPEAVTQFLDEYDAPDQVLNADPAQLKKYIEAECQQSRLTRWVVRVSGGRWSSHEWALGPHRGKCVTRAWKNKPQPVKPADLYKINTLTDPEDEHAGLTEDQKNDAKAASERHREEKGEAKTGNSKPVSGMFYRLQRKKEEGLLIIYPIDPKGTEAGTEQVPITGFSVSFPRVEGGQASRINYMVNSIYDRDWDY